MKRLNSILLGTTAAILVLGGAPASAQKAPDASGGAQMQGGADTKGGANVQGGAEAQGGASMNKGSAGAEAQGKTQGRVKTKEGDTKAAGKADSKSRTTTQGKADSDSSARGKAESDSESGTQGRAQTDQGDTKSRSEGRALGGSEKSSGDRAGAGGGDRGDAAVQFTQEHKTKVKTYFQQNKVSVEPVTDVDISVSVGTAVPSHIAFHPLPDTIFVGLPHDHEYVYFVYHSDIIIVEADTHVIVYVVSNVV